jgi:asparagine synthase (glutamine-hydrolysing)
MCGICGVIYPKDKLAQGDILKRMRDTLIHRGPDDSGMFINENVGLGVQRLSIIDVAGGHQPICNEDETIWIIFNGEIYNYLELMEFLQKKGHRFYTRTDTECIVHLYEELGIECFKKLRGMFAFAIWDNDKKHLHLARDRFGIKPLYYTEVDGKFIFASEIKAILEHPVITRDVDMTSLHDYLTFLYVPSPRTMFKGIKKLPAAHWLKFDEGKIHIERYWKLEFKAQPEWKIGRMEDWKEWGKEEMEGKEVWKDGSKCSEEEYAERVYECLKDSVKMRLMSEVPLGAFLSGGVDSSGIVAMMGELMSEPVKTFSIGFKSRGLYNELPYARLMAKRYNTEHHEFIVEPNIVELVPKVVWHLDEPIADASAILNYLVAQMAKEHVTVVLTGLGGDEVFAGYRRYCGNRMAQWYEKIPSALRHGVIERFINILPASREQRLLNYSLLAKKFIAGAHLSPEERYFSWNSFFTEELKASLYSEQLKARLNNKPSFTVLKGYFDEVDSPEFLDKSQYVDQKTYLVEDPLMLTDKMSMANSLEARVPLLDHKLAELAANIPASLRLKGMKTKYILKKALTDIVPQEILQRQKQGFAMPIDTWLRNGLSDWCRELLSKRQIEKRGYFNYDTIRWIIEQHQKGRKDFSQHIWALVILEIWHTIFIDGR